MSSSQFARFTGAWAAPFGPPGQGHGPGVCKSCGCDSAECRCGCRQCRKEAKELTVTGDASTSGSLPSGGLAAFHLAQAAGANAAGANPNTSSPAGSQPATGLPILPNLPTPATAFVGGGCCVHISLEYAQVAATAASTVAIGVRDTEGTFMMWMKDIPPGTPYQIKENVVTTKPGATIFLLAMNATARARWCEVFSC